LRNSETEPLEPDQHRVHATGTRASDFSG
jgi:hypothetical protein